MTMAAKQSVECLGCGKPTDPLRAGHVAILDGQFRYFCGLGCKAAYVKDAPSLALSLDRTADPPPVRMKAREPVATQPEPSPISDPASGERERDTSAPELPEEIPSEPARPTMRSSPMAARIEPDDSEPSLVHAASDDDADTPSSSRRGEMAGAFPPPGAESLAKVPASRKAASERATLSPPAPSRRERLSEPPPVSRRDREDTKRSIKSEPEAPASRLREGPASRKSDDAITPYLAPSIEYADEIEEEPVSLPAPLTMRSGPASSVRHGARARDRGEAMVLPIATAAVGVATFAAPLAGFGSLYLRAGLALGAGLLLIAWTAKKPKSLGNELPALSALAPLGLVVVACLAVFRGIGQAGVIASTAGAAIAFDVLSQLLVLRAESDVRAHTAELSALVDADARKANGTAEGVLVETKTLRLGDVVIVREGETLVVDGVVTEGTATVLPWAHASSETSKKEGDAVIAGLRVVVGEISVAATALGRERLVTRPFVGRETSGMFGLLRGWTPRALPLACILVGAAELASNAPWLVVVAAALAAGTSLSVAGALATLGLAIARTQQEALASGIAFKDPRALEVAGMSDVAVLCSRGTVLMGEPEVIAVDALVPSHPRKRILALASGAELSNGSPASRALLGAASAEGASPEALRSVLRHDGLGVTALLPNGDPLVVGSRALLLKERISVAASEDRVRELEAQGASVLLVGVAGKLVGLVAFQDALRPGARAAIQRLLEARVEPVLVSGETREACETLARALDIEHVRPEVLPTDRAAEVSALGEGGHVVAVLGRVPQDEAALAAADVSIALGSVGESGDFSVVLATDDVRSAAHALSLARALRERARLGLGAAFAPSVIAVLGLGFGVMPMVLAPVAGFLAAVFGLLAVRRVSSEESSRS